jgi:hypothetical protein
MRKLLFAMPFCFAVQVAFSEHGLGADTEITSDPEPNWNTAVYSCPLSIETQKGVHTLLMFSVYNMKNNNWYELAPEHRKYVYFRHLENDNIFLSCKYGQEKEMEILVRAKNTVACGGNGKPGHLVCWTTDP